jgi:cytochrome c
MNGVRWSWLMGMATLLAGPPWATFALATDQTAAMGDTPDQVKALVERAGSHIKAVGRERAFADFTDPRGGFVEGERYVFCIDGDGISLAHGGNPKLVGKNLQDIRDPNGVQTTVGIFRAGQTEGRGWFEYLWPNPETRRIQRKATFFLRIDDRTVCGAGYYRPDPP